jgi:hypothetical protein
MSESQPPITLVAEGAEYALLASDDATTFVLRFKTDGMAAQMAGEDATRFQADYDTIKQQHPTWQPDQLLAQLWDQGGYSWLAAQEG